MAKQGMFFFSASERTSRIDGTGDADRDVGDRDVGAFPLEPFSLLPLPLPLPLGLADGVVERAEWVTGPGTATVCP